MMVTSERETRIGQRLKARREEGLFDALLSLRGVEMGERFRLVNLLAVGGEGAIFTVQDQRDPAARLVGKIALQPWHRPIRMTSKRLKVGRGIIAAEAAYNECEDWLDQLVDYVDGTQALVESLVSSQVPRVRVVKPEGTYLSWLDVSDAIDRVGAGDGDGDAADAETPEERFQRYLVEHARIHINPGSSYGTTGSGHMRMNIATSRQLVQRAVHNLADALASV